MRGSIIATWWLLSCTIAFAESYPHTATVKSLNVTSRSGPSYGSYPTERLAKHSQVEVIKEGPAGWVAIRPPGDAFDWLPASAVKLAPDRKSGEIVSETIPAHLGSNVKKVEKHVAHVHLKQGDTVRILAEKSVQRSGGVAEVWLKIAPPAEDIRWVQAKHLASESPEQLAAKETADRLAREDRYRRENAAEPGILANLTGEARSLADARRDDDVARAQFLRRGRTPLLPRRRDEPKTPDEDGIGSIEIDKGTPTETLGTEDDPKEASPRVVGTDAPDSSSRTSSRGPRPRISLDPKGTLPRLPLREKEPPITAKDTARELPQSASVPPLNAASQTPSIDSAEFKQRLMQLEVDLTSMVAAEPSTWNLAALHAQAEELVAIGPSARERGRARLVLDRIHEFAATLPAEQEELALTPPANQPAPAAPPKADFDAHYDAIGYLMPIVGARPGTPQYQLTDKDGRTLSFVTARPGVNLNHYVKKQVGLYGQRGYVETLKKPHVVAERVVELDTRQR